MKWIASFLMVVATCAFASAAEDGQFPPEELNELLKHADRGEPLAPEQLRLIEKFAKKRLVRVAANALEDASFSLAQLQVKAERGEKAVETLQKLATLSKNADVKSAAQYNIGKVYWAVLNNKKSAAEAFVKVTGRFALRARRDLLRMYQEGGQTGKAVEYLQAAVKVTKNKGEKLALLRQLAELCKQAGKTEDAIAAYRQITENFTQDDIAEVREEAAKHVRAVFDKCLVLQRTDRWEEAEKLLHKAKLWLGHLAEAGRQDEFRAAREEMHKGWQRIKQQERKGHERERREEEAKRERDD
jgi:tetratricopeptide (TPR) repeat protein